MADSEAFGGRERLIAICSQSIADSEAFDQRQLRSDRHKILHVVPKQ